MKNKIILGDCLDVMKQFDDNTFDTGITDPPYGLGFMGKDWDADVPSPKYWMEVCRVLKPGAFLLCFAGTRTSHWMGVSIEKGGFEIRDTIMWLYGQGFPKSYDISKGIDKNFGVERTEIIRPGVGYESSDDKNTYGHGLNAGYKQRELKAPASEESKLWDGWGTSLKPAWEPIIVAMKPKDGTFVNNALTWGVSGLNIDGARVPLANDEDGYTINTWDDNAHPFGDGAGNPYTGRQETKGRWPANILLDEYASELLDKQTQNVGNTKPHSVISKVEKYEGYGNITKKSGKIINYDEPNSRGTSRFFYCAKASPKERTMNGKVKNNHPTVKPLALMEYLCTLTKTPFGGSVLDPFLGSGTTALACINTGRIFVGIEKEKSSFEIAKARINETLT